MTNQPCIYFKKTWKQPCYFWKHRHLFGATWQEGVTVQSSLKNRESAVPPTALLRTVTSDLKKPRRRKVPPWKSPKLTQTWQWPTADSSSEGARALPQRDARANPAWDCHEAWWPLKEHQILITIILSILFMCTSSKADTNSMPPQIHHRPATVNSKDIPNTLQRHIL